MKIIGQILILFLSSCSVNTKQKQDKTYNETSVEVNKETSAETNKETSNESINQNITKYENLTKLYTNVLDNAKSYDFVDFDNLIKEELIYSYTLLNTNESDVTLLLLACSPYEGILSVRVFPPNDDFSNVLTSDELLYPTGTGMTKCFISQNYKNKSLYCIEFNFVTGHSITEEI